MMKYVICVAILAVSWHSSWALTDDDRKAIRENLHPHVTVCAKEFGIESAKLQEAKEKLSTEGIDGCFFACMFEKSEVMKGGKFLNEEVIEKAKKYEKSEEDAKAHAAIIKECSSVNSVSDDDKGCKRAKLLADCFFKNRQKFLGE